MILVLQFLLTASIQVALDRVVPREPPKLLRGYVLRKMLDKWEGTVKIMVPLLCDVDRKHWLMVCTDRTANRWVEDLRDVAYEVDDIKDELVTEASKVRKFIPTLAQLKTNNNIRRRAKKVTARINDLMQQKGFIEGILVSKGTRKVLTPSSSVLNEHRVYGRDGDRDAIIGLSLSDISINNGEVCVIPIHGEAGIGKTTVAKLVYHAQLIIDRFTLRIWAHVSEDFDVPKLTETILGSVIEQTCSGEQLKSLQDKLKDADLNWLQKELEKQLSKKTFLVVLDDVWPHSYNDWDMLMAPFRKGNPQSRFIITTRDLGVASTIGTVLAHPLQMLSVNDCFSIFILHALHGRGPNAAPNIDDIRDKVFKKCQGSPLGAVTYGGLLRSSNEVPDRKKWDEVLNRRILDAPEEIDGIIRVLISSYVPLSVELMRCLAHCSILPMGYELEDKHLILLWMAEGLIQQEGTREMEDWGSEYLQKLVTKSFIQKPSSDACRMHGLQSILAQLFARGTSLRMEDGSEETLKKARHLSVSCGQCNSPLNFEPLSKNAGLRSFLHFVPPNQGSGHCNCNFHLGLLSQFRSLRVLCLSGCQISELPDSFGNLKHLRYLDLSNTGIESLPESITSLYNLQTLILKNCSQLRKLPSKFWDLADCNLRHVDIRGSCSSEDVPQRILIRQIPCILR